MKNQKLDKAPTTSPLATSPAGVAGQCAAARKIERKNKMTKDADKARRAAQQRSRRNRIKQAAIQAADDVPVDAELAALQAVDPSSMLIYMGNTLAGMTAGGLRFFELLARVHPSDSFIASNCFGISSDDFAKLRKRNAAVALAGERGHTWAQDLFTRWMVSVGALKSYVSAIHVNKAVFGAREGDDKNVTVNQGVTLVLPRSMTMAECLASKGLTAPLEVGTLSTDRTDTPRNEDVKVIAPPVIDAVPE
jgi:hypothetical protein